MILQVHAARLKTALLGSLSPLTSHDADSQGYRAAHANARRNGSPTLSLRTRILAAIGRFPAPPAGAEGNPFRRQVRVVSHLGASQLTIRIAKGHLTHTS